MSRIDTISFALWAERLPPPQFTVETIRTRWNVSRATAYRWYSDFLKAHRALWPQA